MVYHRILNIVPCALSVFYILAVVNNTATNMECRSLFGILHFLWTEANFYCPPCSCSCLEYFSPSPFLKFLLKKVYPTFKTHLKHLI